MFSEKEIYEKLAEKARATNRSGEERVFIEVPVMEFNKNLNYRESLYWETEPFKGVIIVSDNAD